MAAAVLAMFSFFAALFSFFAIVDGSAAVLVLAPLAVLLAPAAAALAVHDLRRLPAGIDRGAAVGALVVAVPSFFFAALGLLAAFSPAQ
jgi:hypothetical protein